MKDCTIVRKMKHNKEKALEILMERYSTYVVTIVTRIGRHLLNAQDAEEVTADVFYSVWKNRMKLIETDSLKPYIAQIARNMTKNKLRQCRMEEPLEEDILIFTTENTDEIIIQKEQIQFIQELIVQLKYPDKDILISYYFQNLKLDEIAERFQLPLSTVKSKLYRGKNGIIKKFEEGGYCYETEN